LLLFAKLLFATGSKYTAFGKFPRCTLLFA
jgi:hypothetical protein